MSYSSSTAKSQYHHFVPRFILKNFAHPFQPPVQPSKGSDRRNRRKKKDGHYPDDPMLNIINLERDTADIVERPVAKTLGMTDMYRDLRNDNNQHHLEEKFSKLEARAGMVISKIRKAFENGDRDVWITRPERDTLRKFLFIMKYRGSNAYSRYNHDTAQGYSSDDRERLLEYMRKKGFKKPLDVWFDNINAMLEVKMDPQMKWMEWLREHAYPDDAMWFIAHCQMMYLALIHEGPVSNFVNPINNSITQGSYTEFHIFAVISPKLMLVLRSFVLPVPEEDANEEVRKWRERMLEQITAQHIDPLNANSILQDLPIAKARNSYTKIVNGEVVLLEGHDGLHRADDKFCFRYFPISTEHMDRINFIMLENAQNISTIVFKSQPATSRTLKEYLLTPCELNKYPCFKIVGDSPDDPRLKLLRKLEKVVNDMGYSALATYQTINGKFYDPHAIAGQMLRNSFPSQGEKPTDFMQLYAKLGGSLVTFPKDMDQAAKMLNLRIKIDVWSQGLSKNQREDIREKLGQLFCQLATRRVWLYLKHVRFMLRTGEKGEVDGVSDLARLKSYHMEDEAENVIVDASHLIRADRVGHLMWFAAINELHRPKIVGPAGSICECGIRALEEKARLCMATTRMMNLHEAYKIPFLTNEEKIELVTRRLVREDLDEVFSIGGVVRDRHALEKVLFNTIYPCPGGHT